MQSCNICGMEYENTSICTLCGGAVDTLLEEEKYQQEISEKEILIGVSDTPVSDNYILIPFDIKCAPQYHIYSIIPFGIDYAPN